MEPNPYEAPRVDNGPAIARKPLFRVPAEILVALFIVPALYGLSLLCAGIVGVFIYTFLQAIGGGFRLT